MRQGPYELQIIGSNGVAYAEEELDGKEYIRAREGEEYKVKVRIHCDALRHFPSSRAKVCLRLDGIELSYGKRLELNKKRKALFRGFRKDEDTLRSFVFTSPFANAPSVNNHSSTRMGAIEVTIFEAEETGEMELYSDLFDKSPQHSSVQEDKKFWQQASLGTVRGDEFRRQLDTAPRYKWRKLRRDPVATLVLHYHTPEMIDFLKSMQLQKEASSTPYVPTGPPVHIDLSTLKDEVPDVPAPAPVIDLMHDAPVRVKREHTGGGAREGSAQKRSRNSSSSGQTLTQIVDLT